MSARSDDQQRVQAAKPSRRSVLGAITVGASTLAVNACAQLPTSSPVTVEPLAGATPVPPYVRALPPQAGATPEELVTGFVQAGVAAEDDYAVAREYLTPDHAPHWNPDTGVTIYASGQDLLAQMTSEDQVTLTALVVAVVDEHGVRTDMNTPQGRDFTFTVEDVDGQWRISHSPPGVFFSEAAFTSLFTAARLHFLNHSATVLVPDVRWFSVPRVVSSVLSELAVGPSELLGEAVTSAMPTDSGLGRATVTTDSRGAARVIVPPAVASLPKQDRERALTQIEASLRSVPSLADVQLVLDGKEVTVPPDAQPVRATAGSRPIGAYATGVISLNQTVSDNPVQVVPSLASYAVRAPAIDSDGVIAAALNTDATTLIIAFLDDSLPLRETATRGEFAVPSVDSEGYVWTATGTSGTVLALAARDQNADVSVEAGWLAGRTVRQIRVARDGTRMLVLSSTADGSRLDLCAIVRRETGEPVSVTEPVPVRTGITEITAASWYDDVATIVVGRDAAGGDLSARIVDFTQGVQELPALPPGTTRVAGTAVADEIWASTEDATLMRSEGQAWISTGLDARDPSFY